MIRKIAALLLAIALFAGVHSVFTGEDAIRASGSISALVPLWDIRAFLKAY